MQVIVAPSKEEQRYKHSIFLAGGITNCPNWQSEVIAQLKGTLFTVYNPRRDFFDITKTEESQIQVEWEFKKLHEATQLLFWFPKETLCPIVLFELGMHLKTTRPLFLGCHSEYKRKLDVEIQSKLARPERCILYDLKQLVGYIIYYNDYVLGLTEV